VWFWRGTCIKEDGRGHDLKYDKRSGRFIVKQTVTAVYKPAAMVGCESCIRTYRQNWHHDTN
jgi:hypothetical protein